MRGSRAFTAGREFHPALKGAISYKRILPALQLPNSTEVDRLACRPRMSGPQGRCQQTEHRQVRVACIRMQAKLGAAVDLI